MSSVVELQHFQNQIKEIQPLYEEIEYISPRDLFEKFSDQKWNMLLDSADGGQEAYGTNRYSYILVDPFEVYTFQSNIKCKDPLADLRKLTQRYVLNIIENIPPFQGGIAGHLSYDLTHIYHPVPFPKDNDLNFPEICMGFYDLVCSFDHVEKKAYVVSSGLPETEEKSRQLRAIKRLDWFKQQINCNKKIIAPTQSQKITIKSNFTKQEYVTAAEKMIEYIRAGDIFEANLAQRFQTILPEHFNDYELFKELCVINPSPFAAYLNFGEFKILSASPERFIKLHNRNVETRPIKGTRARSLDKTEDDANIRDLLNSEKDFAENIMVVDLMRNDLSMVCEDDSVIVPKLCAHEIYPTVHHLVSVVSGKLRENEDAFSLLKATFPGGSVTGAPKIRAMQIIAEIEPHHRGPYCGSITLIGFDGNMDSSIIIRTYVVKDNLLTFHAGGAIVIDSSPYTEYEETLSKSFALTKALMKNNL